ncbi:hypothetical protein DICVIV_03540 [Dictyocaulus viviparus]|uniref:Uncharacterized protein n=1 Tax=Dictyocaulus viviparus TaxID=29172 RepID=A0A0D8Y6Z1_DICVI|nr:hypothetical protein DICVIV_03540 [Dictyocaulus viviparus]
MGCFNALEQWKYVILCFKTFKNETACSYNVETREGFDHWGFGVCCCRSEKCNQLPPDWLCLPRWNSWWRVFSNFLILFSFLSLLFFTIGCCEGTYTSRQELKRRGSLSSESGSGHKDIG